MTSGGITARPTFPDHCDDAYFHPVCKRCTKLGGLVCLARPGLGELHWFENAGYRDSARGLADTWDALSRREIFTSLVEHYAEQLETGLFDPLGDRLDELLETLAGDSERLEKKLAWFRGMWLPPGGGRVYGPVRPPAVQAEGCRWSLGARL